MGNHHFYHSHHKHHHGLFNNHRERFEHRHHFHQKGGFSLSTITNLISKIPAPILGGLATGAVGVGAHLLMKKFGKKEKDLVGNMDPALQQIYNMGKSQLLNHVGANYGHYVPENLRNAYGEWASQDDLNRKVGNHKPHKNETLREISNPHSAYSQMNNNDMHQAIYRPENRVEKMHNNVVDRYNDAPSRLADAFGSDAW